MVPLSRDGKLRWLPWTGNCEPRRWSSSAGRMKSGAPTSRKERKKWGSRRYNDVDPTNELYGDAEDPLEIPALQVCAFASLAGVDGDGTDKNIGTFGRVRDFVASHRLLWRLSGDAFDRFDLAEQCKRWSRGIFPNRKRRQFQQRRRGGLERLAPNHVVRQQ
jgi:hypothetical protein